MARLGVPIETSREKFDESLDVLLALLSREEVSWEGKYYRFEPLTIMPRPMRQPMADHDGGGDPGVDLPLRETRLPRADHSPRRRPAPSLSTRSTPSIAPRPSLGQRANISPFRSRASDSSPRNAEHKRRALQIAYHYYSQFDNVFTGPGIVRNGFIEALPREQTMEQLDDNLLIGPPSEIADKLSLYAERGVDRFVLNPNFGASQQEMLDTISCFAEEIVPLFRDEAVAGDGRRGSA